MGTINIKKSNALKAYRSADKSGKSLLENLIGKEILSQNIMDRIKTFEDACDEVGTTESQSILLNYSGVDEELLAAQAFLKISIINRSLNEGWKPDWNNSSEYKYYPWFEANKSGFGFSYSDYGIWFTHSTCGSRLCFKNKELAIYAGTQFIDLYNQFLTIK
ncbi:MAG: hypothetical protein A3F72_03080 [Bacteroidetes bacterium RIFCSPLOWO2_12_FULL_35_15]|nr:MAG: hypothetical protein A3F72_03080 [Bacteroidetes bacterium RIFCSPLOWO2_12_FULL_35_15]